MDNVCYWGRILCTVASGAAGAGLGYFTKEKPGAAVGAAGGAALGYFWLSKFCCPDESSVISPALPGDTIGSRPWTFSTVGPLVSSRFPTITPSDPCPDPSFRWDPRSQTCIPDIR